MKKTKSAHEKWATAPESSSENFPKVILSARGEQLTAKASPDGRGRLESEAWLESDEEDLLLSPASALEPLSTDLSVDDTSDVEVQIATV